MVKRDNKWKNQIQNYLSKLESLVWRNKIKFNNNITNKVIFNLKIHCASYGIAKSGNPVGHKINNEMSVLWG